MTNQDNTVRFKARIVAKGFTQVEGLDYQNTYSPTIEKNSIRIFITYCLKNNLKLFKADVETAFLQAPLNEEIFMRAPPGFSSKIGTENVLKLNKACMD